MNITRYPAVLLAIALALPVGCPGLSCPMQQAQAMHVGESAATCCHHRHTSRTPVDGEPVDAEQGDVDPGSVPELPAGACCCLRDVVPPNASGVAPVEQSVADVALTADIAAPVAAPSAFAAVVANLRPSSTRLHVLQCVWLC